MKPKTCAFGYKINPNPEDLNKVFTKPYTKKRNKPKPIVHTFKTLVEWSDVDFQMLHFCFEKLCDFVEKEKGLEHIKFNYDWYLSIKTAEDRKQYCYSIKQLKKVTKESKELYEAVKYLYSWWTETYLPLYNSGKWDALYDEECGRIEQENLIKLINIRRSLWI